MGVELMTEGQSYPCGLKGGTGRRLEEQVIVEGKDIEERKGETRLI